VRGGGDEGAWGNKTTLETRVNMGVRTTATPLPFSLERGSRGLYGGKGNRWGSELSRGEPGTTRHRPAGVGKEGKDHGNAADDNAKNVVEV
jgi:hypothetical protein